MITDKELIRRALLGSWEAQKECTEKGIAIPCPVCQEDKRLAKWDVKGGAFVECIRCHAPSGLKISRAKALKSWTPRPAPPIGRCKDCSWYLPTSKRCKYSLGGLWGEVNALSFCSEFKHREGTEGER